MGIKGFIALAVCVFSVLTSSSGLAAKGGNKAPSFSPMQGVIKDVNGDAFASLVAVNDENFPAILAVMELTDPNGLARQGMVGIYTGAFLPPLMGSGNEPFDASDHPALYYESASCAGQPFTDRYNASVKEQMAIDPIIVAGDQFWMTTIPFEQCGGLGISTCPLGIYEYASYIDILGECHDEPIEIVNPIEVFLVEENIYLKYPPNYTIGFQ